jgi:iron complex outermembrane receptor protein
MILQRAYLLVYCLLLSTSSLFSQDCNTTVKIKVIDEHNGENLEYAQLWIPEIQKGYLSDSLGVFDFKNICKGFYHFEISHIGCESRSLYSNITSDTTLVFYLEHHGEILNELTISEEKIDFNSTKSKYTISEDRLKDDAGKPLGELMKRIPGVNALKSGNGISKPMIHGMFGNRIGIINSDSPLAGQQWGVDHAPEIDPFNVGLISIIKGSAAIRYGMQAMGGAVVLEPKTLPKDPHIHGRVLTGYQTNGRLKTINAQLEKGFDNISMRIIGTLKHGGDQYAPNYYLTNTGVREQNFSIQVGKSTVSNWNIDLMYSLFNTENGILRGSHVGNLSDLEDAIGRDVPFFTAENFSNTINSPRQYVTHHTARIKSQYFFDESRFLELIVSTQLDQRKEFDIRRQGRSSIPSLSLSLFDVFQDLVYTDNSNEHRTFQFGIQNRISNNSNDPETGVVPLIPNYGLWSIGAFSSLQFNVNNYNFESGIRYDFQRLNAVFYSGNDLIDDTRQFNNVAFNIGVSRNLSSNFNLKWDNSLVSRSPFVNELYSYGLHQGVSGIEEGNGNLNAEKSFKSVIDLAYSAHNVLEASASIFYQSVGDFIYLSPQEEYRLTIRGAFPVFKYLQTDVDMFGFDFMSTVNIMKNFSWETKFSWLKSENKSNGYAIIYMPPFFVENGLRLGIAKYGGFNDLRLSLSGKYVAKQVNMNPTEDFLEVPPAYFLTNLSISGKFRVFSNEASLSISADNLFDISYRDYLSRLRYFSDEPGRSLNFVLNYKF